MRYGIFSDVHSNLEAFEEAVSFYKKKGIDKFIFLGDIVGYGANPREVISLLREMKPISIAGNHDWAVIGKFDKNNLNSYAKEAIIWTQHRLSEEEKQFLHTFSLTYEDKDFICTHSSLIAPEDFSYILDIEDAYWNFQVLGKKICFIGHSHRQGVFSLRGGRVFFSQEKRIQLNEADKYIINVGSVGQPRDRDNRLSICIYDEDKKIVTWERLEYNIKKSSDKILREGLPSILARRLYEGW